MSNRERWTIYPLIFLTLGIALKDKLIKLVNVDLVACKSLVTEQVACKKLVVTDQQGNPRVVINTNPSGGFIRADGTSGGSVVLGHSDNLATLMFINLRGQLVAPSFTVPVGPPPKPPAKPEADSPEEASPGETNPAEDPSERGDADRTPDEARPDEGPEKAPEPDAPSGEPE